MTLPEAGSRISVYWVLEYRSYTGTISDHRDDGKARDFLRWCTRWVPWSQRWRIDLRELNAAKRAYEIDDDTPRKFSTKTIRCMLANGPSLPKNRLERPYESKQVACFNCSYLKPLAKKEGKEGPEIWYTHRPCSHGELHLCKNHFEAYNEQCRPKLQYFAQNVKLYARFNACIHWFKTQLRDRAFFRGCLPTFLRSSQIHVSFFRSLART